jgi:hypothetical protein
MMRKRRFCVSSRLADYKSALLWSAMPCGTSWTAVLIMNRVLRIANPTIGVRYCKYRTAESKQQDGGLQIRVIMVRDALRNITDSGWCKWRTAVFMLLAPNNKASRSPSGISAGFFLYACILCGLDYSIKATTR